MLERPLRPDQAEALAEVALPRRNVEDEIGDRPERVEAGEHLQDGEGQQAKEDEREIPEVVLVIDTVADQGPADEIPAEQLHEHDGCARDGREAVVHDQRQRQPEAARENQQVDGGRTAAGVVDPAPDQERKQHEQQHPVRRQHAAGELKVPGISRTATISSSRPGAVASAEARFGPGRAAGSGDAGNALARAGSNCLTIRSRSKTIPGPTPTRTSGRDQPRTRWQISFYRSAFPRKAHTVILRRDQSTASPARQ